MKEHCMVENKRRQKLEHFSKNGSDGKL